MKRFTECEKWRDPWFRGLSLEAKLVFWYLTENCDGAGVWEPDYELVNFTFKRDLAWDEIKAELAKDGRLLFLANGRWHMPKFIGFQYGELREECPPHRHVLRLVEKHGLHKDNTKGRQRVVKPFAKGSHTLQEKEKDKEKDSDTKQKQTDSDFIHSLRTNPAYQGIDVDRERGKAEAWCAANKRVCSRRFFVNWLNKAERPLGVVTSGPSQAMSPRVLLMRERAQVAHVDVSDDPDKAVWRTETLAAIDRKLEQFA